jgi:hypothetical protein
VNQARRIVTAQDVRVQALGGVEEFFVCGHLGGPV